MITKWQALVTVSNDIACKVVHMAEHGVGSDVIIHGYSMALHHNVYTINDKIPPNNGVYTSRSWHVNQLIHDWSS